MFPKGLPAAPDVPQRPSSLARKSLDPVSAFNRPFMGDLPEQQCENSSMSWLLQGGKGLWLVGDQVSLPAKASGWSAIRYEGKRA